MLIFAVHSLIFFTDPKCLKMHWSQFHHGPPSCLYPEMLLDSPMFLLASFFNLNIQKQWVLISLTISFCADTHIAKGPLPPHSTQWYLDPVHARMVRIRYRNRLLAPWNCRIFVEKWFKRHGMSSRKFFFFAGYGRTEIWGRFVLTAE